MLPVGCCFVWTLGRSGQQDRCDRCDSNPCVLFWCFCSTKKTYGSDYHSRSLSFFSFITYKVAQSTFQYYFVVQSLHKARSITTLLWQPMPMLMAPWSFRRRSGKTVFSDLSMAVCWDFLSEINSIWSIFVVLRLCCPVVVTVTRKGNIRIYIYISVYIYICRL